MERPLLVEIIAYAPTAFYHCTHCEIVWREAGASQPVHQEQLRSSLPDDLANEYQQVSRWVEDIFRRYSDRVTLKVIDAASPEGVFKTVRYGAHHYPAVIIDHRACKTGQPLDCASATIARMLDGPAE